MPKVFKELPASSAERSVKVLSGRWKIHILWQLSLSAMRFAELKKSLPDVVEKTFVAQLKELEHHGLIHRKVSKERPVRVIYSLTSHGKKALPIIKELCTWGRTIEV